MEDITNFVKNTKERLDLKNDYVFKRIFAKPENNQELKELLEAILNIEIEKVEVKNPEITKNYTDEKLGVLDIRAQINEDTIIDIEMQVANVKRMVNRNIAYTSRLIAEDTRAGEDYRFLKKFISITILGENLLERNAYHSISHLKFEDIEPEKQVEMGYEKEQDLLTDRVEVHYIELKKFVKKNPKMSSKLEQWLWLIKGEEEKVKMASEKNKTIEKVVEDLDEMSADQNERLEAYRRQLIEWNYKIEKEELKKEAKEEGLQEGRREGAQTEKEKNTLKMLEKGIDIQTIIEITGLTANEIERLRSTLENKR